MILTLVMPNSHCYVSPAISFKKEIAMIPNSTFTSHDTPTIPLAMPAPETATHPRERLIMTASALVHNQGWTATGINQILSDAGIPKGSFYYYFRSKETLGIAVLARHRDNLVITLASNLNNPTLPADRATEQFFDDLIDRQSASGFKLGCPIGSFASEIATLSPGLLEEARGALKLYEDAWTKVITRGQQQGLFALAQRPEEMGKAIAMLVQGALQAMKCEQTQAPLNLARTTVEHWLHIKRIHTSETLLAPALAS